MNLMLVLLLIVGLTICVQNWLIWKKLNSGEEQKMLEENVQAAMDRIAEKMAESHDKENARDGSALDKGFENIMTYSVALGRGRMSEGEPWNV